jgi:hypothetical protein
MPPCEGRISKAISDKGTHRTGQCTNPAFLQVAVDEDDDESAVWLCKKCTRKFLGSSQEWYGIFDDGKPPSNFLNEIEWLKKYGSAT